MPIAVPRIAHAAAARIAAATGGGVCLDGPALLGERAAIAQFARGGDLSCGRATRLLRASDGWVSLSVARPDDVEMLPAWLDGVALPGDPDELWAALADVVRRRGAMELVARAAMLGLPCSRLGETVATGRDDAVIACRRPGRSQPSRWSDLVVVDLSSLWAGPLCAHVLGLAGARVVKIESAQRPDGARHGPAPFFDLMHGGHESVVVDFTNDAELAMLGELLRRADVVIEASRPRALLHLGVDAARIEGPRVWLRITGHGHTGGAADRVAFGDDAAVAGGLVSVAGDGSPCFCADAVADPLTGLVAAAEVLERIAGGGHWLLDVALARTAATVMAAGSATTMLGQCAVAAPRARQPAVPARPLGADTDAVLGAVKG